MAFFFINSKYTCVCFKITCVHIRTRTTTTTTIADRLNRMVNSVYGHFLMSGNLYFIFLFLTIQFSFFIYYLFILQYFKRVNTFSRMAILPYGPLQNIKHKTNQHIYNIYMAN